jgi:lipoprotein
MRKTHSLFLLSLVCLGLAGCSSTSPISLGQGKYLISDTNGLYLKGGAVLKDILEEAKTFCTGQGKEVLVHDIKTINSSAVEDAGADLIFSCKDATGQ